MGEPARVLGEEMPVNVKPRHDIFTLKKVRNLYVFQDKSHAEIARECGMTLKAVGNMVSRQGWAKEKVDRLRRLEKLQRARESNIDPELVEALASASEQHALRGLQRTGEALERDDEYAAKDFQSYTAGVKNLVGIVKALRDPGSDTGSQSGPAINFFFAPAAPAATGEPKQVVEVEARPVQ